MRPSLRLLLAIVPLLAGCFDPDYPETATCNQKPRECPEDYVCVPEPEANVCVRASNAPPPTIGVRLSPSTVRLKATTPDLLEITVSLTGFAIDPESMGQPNEARFGHYHVFLDELSNFEVSTGNYLAGKELILKIPVVSSAAPFKTAKIGTHQLFVSLANNNHSEVNPPVRAQAQLVIAP